MSNSQASLPTKDDLQKLSRHAIIAYAILAAQRVQPLFGVGKYQPSEEDVITVDTAIRMVVEVTDVANSLFYLGNSSDQAWNIGIIFANMSDTSAHPEIMAALEHAESTGSSQYLRAFEAKLDVEAFLVTRAVSQAIWSFNVDDLETTVEYALKAASCANFVVSIVTSKDNALAKQCQTTYRKLLDVHPATNKYSKVDFKNFPLWDDKIPMWFLNALYKNEKLLRYWENKELNPWNLLEVGRKRSAEIIFVREPQENQASGRGNGGSPPHVGTGELEESDLPEPSTPDDGQHDRGSQAISPASSPEPADDGEAIEDDREQPDELHPPAFNYGAKNFFDNKEDHESRIPCLDVEQIAEGLADTIRNTDHSVCLGIFGPWGRGKTFFMQQVEKKIKNKNESSKKEVKYEVLWHDAWKYRSSPESWAYLYERFAEVFREYSWFAAIRAGVLRHGLGWMLSAMVLISLPWFLSWLYPTAPSHSFRTHRTTL